MVGLRTANARPASPVDGDYRLGRQRNSGQPCKWVDRYSDGDPLAPWRVVEAADRARAIPSTAEKSARAASAAALSQDESTAAAAAAVESPSLATAGGDSSADDTVQASPQLSDLALINVGLATRRRRDPASSDGRYRRTVVQLFDLPDSRASRAADDTRDTHSWALQLSRGPEALFESVDEEVLEESQSWWAD